MTFWSIVEIHRNIKAKKKKNRVETLLQSNRNEGNKQQSYGLNLRITHTIRTRINMFMRSTPFFY